MFWFGDMCEDGHLLHPTGDPDRSYECERCGMGFWDAGECTQDFDVDAYAHALGMRENSGGGPHCGTTLPARMVSEENSDPCRCVGHETKGRAAPHPIKLFAAATPPVGGEPARR